MKMRSLSFVLVLVFLCTSSFAALAATNVDLTTWIADAGTWSLDSEQGLLVQSALDGGARMFRTPEGFQLPKEFTFSAEMGIVGGNNASARPFVSLGFNATLDEANYRYEFRYRQSGNRYEIRKVTPDFDGYVADGATVQAPWPWELQEWRKLTVVRTADMIRAYVNDELMYEVAEADLQGGGLYLWTFSTAVHFRNIEFVPQAVTPDGSRSL